jgi:hypothetical protein
VKANSIAGGFRIGGEAGYFFLGLMEFNLVSAAAVGCGLGCGFFIVAIPFAAAWQPSLAPFRSEIWNDRPRDLKPIVREFKNEDVTEMASTRLDEML